MVKLKEMIINRSSNKTLFNIYLFAIVFLLLMRKYHDTNEIFTNRFKLQLQYKTFFEINLNFYYRVE